MRRRGTTGPLPLNWYGLPAAKPALLMVDIAATKRPRLFAKLVVFRRRKELRAFWRTHLYNDPGPFLCGCVNELVSRASLPSGGELICTDPRYFAVIGLIATDLTMDTITHESIHAAFALDRRRHLRRADNPSMSRRFPDHPAEEAICYPAGRIAANIVGALRKAKLLP